MGRRVVAALAAIAAPLLVTAACGSSSPSASGSSASAAGPVSTVQVDSAQYPFDETSAKQFPGKSLDERLRMAQEVCDSIKATGGDYPAWLKLTLSRTDLVSFSASQQVLTSFSGLAVRYVCPDYLTQLQGALSSLSSELSSSGGTGN